MKHIINKSNDWEMNEYIYVLVTKEWCDNMLWARGTQMLLHRQEQHSSLFWSKRFSVANDPRLTTIMNFDLDVRQEWDWDAVWHWL